MIDALTRFVARRAKAVLLLAVIGAVVFLLNRNRA